MYEKNSLKLKCFLDCQINHSNYITVNIYSIHQFSTYFLYAILILILLKISSFKYMCCFPIIHVLQILRTPLGICVCEYMRVYGFHISKGFTKLEKKVVSSSTCIYVLRLFLINSCCFFVFFNYTYSKTCNLVLMLPFPFGASVCLSAKTYC